MSCNSRGTGRVLVPPYLYVTADLPASGNPGDILRKAIVGDEFALEWYDQAENGIDIKPQADFDVPTPPPGRVALFVGTDLIFRIKDSNGVISVVTGQDGAIGPAGPQGPQGPQGIQGVQGIQGPAGVAGNNGWSPTLAVVSDGERRVLQVQDWQGGTGTKPATGQFVGATGLVATAALAVDIRGPQGAVGPTGPAGATGPAGPTGATGPQGPAGVFTEGSIRVRNTGSQALTVGAQGINVLNYNTLDYANGGLTFNDASDFITVPSAGRYHITTNFLFNAPAVGVLSNVRLRIQVDLLANGTWTNVAECVQTASLAVNADITLQASSDFSLPANARVRCVAQYTSTLGAVLSVVQASAADPFNYLAVHLIGGTQGATGPTGAGSVFSDVSFANTRDPLSNTGAGPIPDGYVTPGIYMQKQGVPTVGLAIVQTQGRPTIAVNECYARPFFINRPTRVTGLRVNVVTGAVLANANSSWRIYNNSNGRPGTPATDKLTVSLNGTGLKTANLAAAVTLQPGIYWMLVNTINDFADVTQIKTGFAYPLFYGGRMVTGLFASNAAARLDSADNSANLWSTDTAVDSYSSTADGAWWDFTPV